MKAKKHPHYSRRISGNRSGDDPLPFELGAHLFAIIRRNLAAPRKPEPAPPVQMTFAL